MNNEKRRRLEPLRINPAQPNQQDSGPAVQPASTQQRNPSRGGLSIVLGLVAVLGLAVGVTGAALILKASPPAPPAVSPPASSTIESPAVVPAIVPNWTSLLHAASCPAPCSGGAACEVTIDNVSKGRCQDGEQRCNACLSGVTCIPGDRGALFAGDELWSLYLSAIAERGPGRSVSDPCKTQRDLWLCIQSRSQPKPSCVSQVEACRNGARSTTAVPITSHDLTSAGFDFEVREGGADGQVVATKTGAKYADGILRHSLCGGLKVTFPDTTPIGYVAYFLDARTGIPSP